MVLVSMRMPKGWALASLLLLGCDSPGDPDPGTSGGRAGAGNGGSNGGASSGAGGAGSSGAAGSGAAAGANAGGAGGSAGANGGAGASGGAGAAGTAGAAGSAGADRCSSALFCDDFEGVPANGPPASSWAVQASGSAAVAIDGTHRVSGAQAVRMTVPSGPGGAFIALRNAPVFPTPSNGFYGRALLWLAAAPEASVHWTLVEARGLVAGQAYRAAYRIGGQQPITDQGSFVGSQLMANYETPDSYGGTGPSSDCWRHANRVVVPVARWACVEWRFDGPSNTITLWLDGTEVFTMSGTGQGCVHQSATYLWTAPVFSELRLGWESYQADGARSIWLDDVALASDRLGCPSTASGI